MLLSLPRMHQNSSLILPGFIVFIITESAEIFNLAFFSPQLCGFNHLSLLPPGRFDGEYRAISLFLNFPLCFI